MRPVYVRHGAPNEEAELMALSSLAVADERFIPSEVHTLHCRAEFDGHIPFRNALLLTSALAAFPRAEAIAYGALLGEGSGDKSKAFGRHLAKAWSVGEGRKVALLTPLAHLTKSRALGRGLSLPGGQHLWRTVSCYHGDQCGRCQACFRRGIAEYLVGLRSRPPALPRETKGVWQTLRNNRITRWPSLGLANIDVAYAYAKYRLHQ